MSAAGRRSRAAQRPPPPLEDFPAGPLRGSRWFREHGYRDGVPDGGCWFFASLPDDARDGGRFDLGAPWGTCYLADRALAAALERVGRFTAAHKPVPGDLVKDRVVTEVGASELPTRILDLTSSRAATELGVTGELFTMADYTVPQLWAAAAHTAGHEGLRYTPRFSPYAGAVAVFGAQGPDARAVGRATPLRDVLTEADVDVVAIPPSGRLTMVAPPER